MRLVKCILDKLKSCHSSGMHLLSCSYQPILHVIDGLLFVLQVVLYVLLKEARSCKMLCYWSFTQITVGTWNNYGFLSNGYSR